MKKVKGILLFGILTLLGIGSSFSVDVNNVFGSITNSNGTRHFYSNIATSQDIIFFMGMYNNNIGNVLFSNTQSDISSYNNSMYWAIFNTKGNVAFAPGIYANKVGSFTLNWSNPYISYYINGSGNFGFNYLHLFYLGGSFSNYSNYYMATSTGIYSSGLTIYDIKPGYERKKIFPLVSSSFSSISSNGTDFEFSYIPFDGISSDGIYNITGIVLFHFDFYSGGYVSGNNTVILFKDNSNIYYNIFDSYSDSVLDFVDSIPISKGVLSNGYSSFVNMIQDNGYMVETYGNSSSLILHSIDSQTTASTFTNVSTVLNTHPYNEYTFTLTENSSVSHWYDFLNGGETQSSGSMAINTGLINTGLFNLCLTSPSFYDLNTIFCNRVFGGRDLSYVQGLISSGAYLQSYIDGSGNLVYVVDIYDEPPVLTGVVSWECYGDRCINTELGSWGDVEPGEILHLSGGDILSSGYYLGFFESINETGYFFKCPYSYNNSRWVAGRSILNAIGRDPFLPINCFIAGYENGRRVKLFDEAFNGYSRGPLMNGDTQNHRNLFTFFDILLSVALIFFLMKFYHLFK